MTVGQHSQSLDITALASVPPVELDVLSSFGASSIEGSAEAPVEVHAPQGDIAATVTLVVPRTAVPSSGSAEIRATGTPPLLTPSQPGDGDITAGNTLSLQFTPLTASGGETGLGTLNATCTLDPGQNQVLGSFVITRPAPAARTVYGSALPGGGAQTHPGSPSPSHSPSASGGPTAGVTSPAPAPTTTTSGTDASGLFGTPPAILGILLAMVTTIVCAIAFIAFVAFTAGRLSARRRTRWQAKATAMSMPNEFTRAMDWPAIQDDNDINDAVTVNAPQGIQIGKGNTQVNYFAPRGTVLEDLRVPITYTIWRYS
jgi:hypothetical protein